MPSSVSPEAHKELTLRQIIHHLGFFASDAVLENEISSFFAKRADRALSHAKHLQDPEDPSGLILNSSSSTDLLSRLRFSSHTLSGNRIRQCSTQELQAYVSAFLDLRPHGYAHQKSKRLAILEAMDSSKDWESKKDAE